MGVGTQASLSQASYEETPYADSTWEIVGKPPEPEHFEPMGVPVLAHDEVLVDPMFADYGGRIGTEAAQRWHLPEHLAVVTEQEGEAEKEGPAKVALLPEEIERLKAEAYEAGRSAAAEELSQAHAADLKDVQTRLQSFTQDLAQQIQTKIQETEREAVKLSLAVAEKIIGTTVEVNPEYIVPIIEKALSLAGTAIVKRVRVSPQDLEFIQVEGIAPKLPGSEETWEFVADESIRSGCIVESSAGQIDFRLDESWARVRDQVVRVIR